MLNKFVASILIVAFLNLGGCASIQSFTVSEYKQSGERHDKPDKITVVTKEVFTSFYMP